MTMHDHDRLRAAEQLRERAAEAASEAELRTLWHVWRRLTLAGLRPTQRAEPEPPWSVPAAAPAAGR